MKTKVMIVLAACAAALAMPATAQEVLPFPPTPSASKAGVTIQDSTYQRRVSPQRLAKDAPNVLIILLDDVGPGVASTYGGEVNTPALDRVARAGISYNRFHSTAMCSPTRAALLTGRNHTRVGNGQIAEGANDWDAFSGVIPKTAATVAEVLKNYGYNTSAFGKWHNTPTLETTANGPFDNWPTGYGFEYFYGFMAGESSQYEPRVVRNTTFVDHPEKSGGHDRYHFSEDIADDAIGWLRKQRAYAPDKPFFMYWAPGAAHAPHHAPKEWADKYKGKFNDGWDKYRERVYAKAKAKGWIPQNAQLTPRPSTLPAWDSIPEAEKPFQRRQMEVWAGYVAHADYQAGRVLDEIEKQGKLENTLVFYVMGDNGSSAEGINGTLSELLGINELESSSAEQIKILNELGGLDVLGSNKMDNHFHSAWAWAGSTPYKSTKLIGAHFGGTRQNLAVSWPAKIRHDGTPRPQFHHVIDIVPTIYEAAKITAPRVVNGFQQDPMDGISMAYTFADAKAKDQRTTQFFDIHGSRGIYKDGWFAGTFGVRVPWVQGIQPGFATWNPQNDVWELYNLNEDWTQANDLAAKMPEKLASMKDAFLVESAKNNNLPIGGSLWAYLHPDDLPKSPYTEWTFMGPITGTPEFAGPKLGVVDTTVSMDLDVPANANGVLYAVGGYPGGITCFVKDGVLNYEYNLFMVNRTKIKASEKLPTGPVKIEVVSKLAAPKRNAPMDIVLKVNGKEVGKGQVPVTLTGFFSFSDGLDFGADLGSPVSADYFDLAPFKFNGTINETRVWYPAAK